MSAERGQRVANYAPIGTALAGHQIPELLKAAYYFKVRPLVVMLYTTRRADIPDSLIDAFRLKGLAFSVKELLELVQYLRQGRVLYL